MIEYVVMAFFAVQAPMAQAQALSRAEKAKAAPEASPPQKPVSPKDFKNPVNITADRFEIQARRQEATWTGNVRAVRGRTVLTCERLVAYYTPTQEIRRIECVGNVEATHGDTWARGERAEFDNVTGNLVVTGNPRARQGYNELRGTRIIVDVTRDTIQVEQATTIWEGAEPRGVPRPGTGK
jgi:lipopolysaccharide export system protein LptA